jgi:hypothetical protein
MLKNSFFKTIPFLLFIVLLNSCDKEFNVVGENLVGDNTFDIQKSEYSVVAYNQKIGPVQSNNLETNSLGVYNNPAFGTTTATFATQVTMATVNPTFLATATIKSVVLSIPYFSTKTELKADGSSTYELDSIYGQSMAKMKLSVYESGYFLRDLDPAEQLTQPQKYYSNQYPEFSQLKKGTALNNSTTNAAENSAFWFDPAEHIVTTIVDTKEVVTRTAPAMQLNLDKTFFTEKILRASAASLVDNNAFKNYFKGLFFDIEAVDGTPGNLAMMNFKAGKITITYTDSAETTDEQTFVLNLSGNTVNFLTQSNENVDYTTATSNANTTQGDANLYLKGGEGSMSVLKLFKPGDLEDIRANKYLINEADLTVYLNSAAMSGGAVPQRLYLYDYTNNLVVADYTDATFVSSNSKYNKYVFGGILGKDKDGANVYKFRITNHIRNLVKSTSNASADLGLVVTEDVNKYAFYALRDKAGIPLYVPMASVMNPLGAIVFGNNIPSDDVNYAKRLKFEIYYTKPN